MRLRAEKSQFFALILVVLIYAHADARALVDATADVGPNADADAKADANADVNADAHANARGDAILDAYADSDAGALLVDAGADATKC